MNILGMKIKDLRNHCTHHPDAELVVKPGVGPHAFKLVCADCGRFAGWLGKGRAAALERTLTTGDAMERPRDQAS